MDASCSGGGAALGEATEGRVSAVNTVWMLDAGEVVTGAEEVEGDLHREKLQWDGRAEVAL